MGYVTCASTRSGLRSQREYTMTCVSLRSGIASSGMCSMDQIPVATATPTNRNTTNLLRPLNSMMRLIMHVSSAWGGSLLPAVLGYRSVLVPTHAGDRRLQLALGIDQ